MSGPIDPIMPQENAFSFPARPEIIPIAGGKNAGFTRLF